MTEFSQEGKTLAIETALGADKLILVGFSGSEFISRPFEFHLEMISSDHAIQAKAIVGKRVDVTLMDKDRSPRLWNGYISEFHAGPRHQNGYRTYQAKLVPWLTLLSFYADCRIFQTNDVKAILEDVFNHRGFSDFVIKTKRGFRQREYTVQYRETDFNFVSRLMEEEGIYYYFTHEAGKHTLVVADACSDYVDCKEKEVRYFVAGKTDDHLSEWNHGYALVSGKWAQTDYNFETPSTDISTTVDTIVDLPDITNYEQYDYPGLYANRGEGDGLTKVRIEEQETAHDIVSAVGTYRSFIAGGKFTLVEHEIASEQGKVCVITSISHQARENSYELGSSGGHYYQNSFQCIPSDRAFRAPCVTPRPKMGGPQTAIVVGPSGEEIYTDKYGRVRVQFYWDRVGEKNDKSTCWLRVSQQWAGKQWGAIFLPRMGHEVIVSFLEGDPDQPLVTGCVYNAENMPPYDLPANKTQSGWKTRSTKQGGTSHFNELRFEDKKGDEQIYIHAEKNQDNVVENDETTDVGHDRTEVIGNDETITIGHDRTENVGNNETISIAANRTESVGKNESISIGDNRSENVGKNEDINIGKNRSEQVGDNETISIGKNQEMTVGKDQKESVGDNREVQIGKNDTLNVGKKLNIIAGDQITLKCGQSTIIMKKDGKIQITGKELNIKMSGNIKMKGSKIAQN